MSTSWKFVEKCTILTQVAEGLCCRLYNAKKQLADHESAPLCLNNKEYQKIRDKLDKSFPDSIDLSKISGYESFQKKCHDISHELVFFNDLVLDVSEFRKSASFLLKDIAASTLHFFKLDDHRAIVFLFFELLVGYYRVLSLLSSIHEKKTIIAVYTSAAFFTTNSTDVVAVSEASVLFNALANGPRLFIDDFASHSDCIGNMMLEFFESIQASVNPESLRSKYVLNPSNDGDSMTHPAKTLLSPTSNRNLFLHVELKEVPRYFEFVAFGFLVCPSLLFNADGKYMDLFRLVYTDQLVVTLYRELNINLHAELESIFTSYPSKKDSVEVPKGFKVKNVIKDIATAAVQTVGLKHRERRSFLLAEIKNLLHIIRTLPGLVGPKFPLYLAAASLSREEIMHYFRHRPLECRKDVKKYLNSNDYYCPHITSLIASVYDLSCAVEEYKDIVSRYYGEYLALIDSGTLHTYCENATAELPDTSNPNIPSILMSLPGLAQNATASSGADMEGFRLNWDRYSTLLGTAWGKFAGPATASLLTQMSEIRERSVYVDNMSHLLKKFFLPTEIWWHMATLNEAFEQAFESNSNPLIFFPVASMVPLNIHEDFQSEAKDLSKLTWRFCDRIMFKVNSHLTRQLDSYWKMYHELEKKTSGKDVISRLEKQYLVKQARDKAIASGKKDASSIPEPPEQYPGYESEGWAAKNIADLIKTRSGILKLMSSARAIGTVLVFNREFSVEMACKEAISRYFVEKLKKSMVHKDDIVRPSLILRDIIIGSRVMQSLCDMISCDLPQLLKSFLFDNFCDDTIPPPGQTLPCRSDQRGEGMVWTIGQWFLKIVDEASAQNSGLMYIPSTDSFARCDAKHRPIDIYINREEIRSLCCFIGPQGVRCIDSMLIEVVAEKGALMKAFIETHKGALSKFRDNFDDLSNISGLESSSFVSAAVKAGVALALRRILHKGLKNTMQRYAPLLKSSVQAVASSVDPLISIEASTPVYSLAFDAGVLSDNDLSLAASLKDLIKTPADEATFSLLPVAFASSFASSYWSQNNIFLPEFGAFRGNQHCIALTASKLIFCLSNHSAPSFSALLKSRQESFIELSANAILAMRDRNAEKTFLGYPTRAFTNILELFLQNSPLIDHYSLEKYLPYAFIHASQMEISMGQVKASDNISNGMDRVIHATSVSNSNDAS